MFKQLYKLNLKSVKFRILFPIDFPPVLLDTQPRDSHGKAQSPAAWTMSRRLIPTTSLPGAGVCCVVMLLTSW